MYERNFTVLEEVVRDKSVIRHVSKHRKPDGTLDIEGNKKIWNDAIARFDQILLWEGGAPGYDDRDPLQTPPSMIFVPAQGGDGTPRGTIIVAHGGGFESRTGCEGMNVAHYFAKAGFNTAILTYRLRPYSRRDAMLDMQRAIRILRCRADELHITDKIAVMGFSAGGMLSGNCATHYDAGNPDADDAPERFSCRPDAAVVCYGAFATVAFPGGFLDNPFRDEDRAEKLYLAPEKNLTPDTPPFFLWQTNSDDPRNSFVLATALTEAGVPFELHCFPDGVHGMALADGNNDLSLDIPHVAHWAPLCAEWLRAQGI